MSRRFQELEQQRAGEQLADVKRALLDLGADARHSLNLWLTYHFDDRGQRFEGLGRRRRITLDDRDYWLVAAPPRRHIQGLPNRKPCESNSLGLRKYQTRR